MSAANGVPLASAVVGQPASVDWTDEELASMRDKAKEVYDASANIACGALKEVAKIAASASGTGIPPVITNFAIEACGDKATEVTKEGLHKVADACYSSNNALGARVASLVYRVNP